MRGSIFLISLVLATPVSAFEGSYSAENGDAFRRATIAAKGAGSYVVDIEMGVPGCLGDLEGAVGRVVGDALVVDHREEFGACRLDIRRHATGIEIKEHACNLHGGRCSFSGVYAAVGGKKVGSAAAPTAAAPTEPRLAGNFYCAAPMNVDAARLRDPAYRLNVPAAGKIDALRYDYSYHAGVFAYSFAGDAYIQRSVKVSIAGTTATYTGPAGARWTVAPVGAATVTIRGKGLEDGEKGVGCVWR